MKSTNPRRLFDGPLKHPSLLCLLAPCFPRNEAGTLITPTIFPDFYRLDVILAQTPDNDGNSGNSGMLLSNRWEKRMASAVPQRLLEEEDDAWREDLLKGSECPLNSRWGIYAQLLRLR